MQIVQLAVSPPPPPSFAEPCSMTVVAGLELVRGYSLMKFWTGFHGALTLQSDIAIPV